MISNLNKGAFQSFGQVFTNLSGVIAEDAQPMAVHLQGDMCPVFLTKSATAVICDQGMAVLSCQKEDGSFCHFYLDKPVVLKEGLHFSLSAFKTAAHIRISGQVQSLENRVREDFRIHRRLKLDTLYTFFYQEKEPGFLFAGERHSVVELIYVDQGQLHSVADGRDILLSQGELALYAPDQWHMQYAEVDVTPRFLTVSFDPGNYDLTPLYNRKFSLSHQQADLLQQMLRQQENPDHCSEDMILCLLTQLLLQLLRSTDRTPTPLQTAYGAKNENSIIRTAQQYIAQNVQGKLSVPEVAKNAGVSTSYLTALFQKHLQISPADYVRRIKLQESKQLIRSGTMNFTQIAALLNYSTVHHFSRQFKGNFGITPSEYARSIK